jgi:NTE family protein
MIDNLIFEGGGALGVAYVGAIEQLGDRINSARRYAGTSVGAIIATALACGANYAFIDEQLKSLDISKLATYSLLRAPWNLYQYYGLSDGAELTKWFRAFIIALVDDENITFRALWDRTGRELIITGTSLRPINGACAHYFTHRTYPDMPIITALRITTCVPGLFQPVKWMNEYWVDGGVLNNYPIEIFHENGELLPRTVGLMLMTRRNDMLDVPPVSSFTGYLYCLMSCYFNQGQKTYIEPEDWTRTIKIKCGKNSAMNFETVQRDQLITAGRDAAQNFIIKHSM